MKFIKSFLEKQRQAKIRRNWTPKFKQKVRVTEGMYRGCTGIVFKSYSKGVYEVTLDDKEKHFPRVESFYPRQLEPADGDWS